MRSLAERLRAHEQQKARLAETEAKLKAAEKRAFTRRLIDGGRFIDRTGLLSLSQEALYGALLSLRAGCDNAKQVEQWTAAGARAMEEEAQETSEARTPILLIFPQALHGDAAAAVRAEGFRFNRLLQHWEGLGTLDQARDLARLHGGDAHAIAPASLAQAFTDREMSRPE